jgi:hypothetical protein
MGENMLITGGGEVSTYRKVDFGEDIEEKFESGAENESEDEGAELKSLPDELCLTKQLSKGEKGHRLRLTEGLHKLTEEEIEILRDERAERKLERRLANIKKKSMKAREKERAKQKRMAANKRRENRDRARREMIKHQTSRQEKEEAKKYQAERKRTREMEIKRENANGQRPRFTSSPGTSTENIQPSQESDTTLTSSVKPNGSKNSFISGKTFLAQKQLPRSTHPSSSHRSSNSPSQIPSKTHELARAFRQPLRPHYSNSITTSIYAPQTNRQKKRSPSVTKGLISPVLPHAGMTVADSANFGIVQDGTASSSASTIRAVPSYSEASARGDVQAQFADKISSARKAPTIRTIVPNSQSRFQTKATSIEDIVQTKQNLVPRQGVDSVIRNGRIVGRGSQIKTIGKRWEKMEGQTMLKNSSEESLAREEEENFECEYGKGVHEYQSYDTEGWEEEAG